jgi:hypothetical protein
VQSIADALAVFLEKRNAPEQFRILRLWEHWSMVMGPALAPLAAPLGHRGKTLLLGAEDPMAAQELFMQREEILERVNAFMDCPCFTGVQIEQMMGRQNLALLAFRRESAPPLVVPRKPPHPESLLGTLDPSNPVTRCYEAYVRYFTRLEGCSPSDKL